MVDRPFYIPFQYFPLTHQTKEQQERQVLAVFPEHRVELVVMAGYMQILSERLLQDVGCPVVNIHHSFLPAFFGAKSYHQAYDRGFKIIEATVHYTTPELDEGPILPVWCLEGLLPIHIGVWGGELLPSL